MAKTSVHILVGDVRARLRELPDESVHCVVTSPPYWGLRDYGVEGQLGLERTPEEYVRTMTEIFRDVRRVLRSDGTAWVNLGDCYASSAPGNTTKGVSGKSTLHGVVSDTYRETLEAGHAQKRNTVVDGLKPKDLVGMPWLLAFALRADGWWLRQDIIWHKPSPMPESVTDRCTKAHEYVFLLSKAARYYYDAEAVREPSICAGDEKHNLGSKAGLDAVWQRTQPRGTRVVTEMRNLRSVWTIPSHAFPEAHFATYPPKLVEPCVKAGCPVGGTVLDPFGGAGTTGMVAARLNRNAILIELNPKYAEMAQRRIEEDSPMFAEVTLERADAREWERL